MRYTVTIADRTVEVELGPDSVRVDNRALAAELAAVPDGPVLSLVLGAESHRVVAYARGRGQWDLRLRGWHLTTEVLDERRRAIRALAGAATVSEGARPVRAPMPGLVVRVEVEEGDRVRPGQGLVIVEAMKMENELRADVAGEVRAVHVRAGQTVEKDQTLIDLAGITRS